MITAGPLSCLSEATSPPGTLHLPESLEHALTRRAMQPARQTAAAPTAPSIGVPIRMDFLSVSVMGAILTYVWRLQDLYPIFAKMQLPSVAALAAISLYLLDHDRRRALKSLRHPITYMVGAILFLAALSVPTSVYPGLSFRFITQDLIKNVLLFVLIAGSVRAFVDVKRYAAALVAGAFIYALYVQLFVTIGARGRLGNLAYYDANDLGLLLVCSIPLALFFVLRAKRALVRLLAGAALALFFLIIIKSGSRGAFLGVIAVTLYLLFLFRAVSAKARWSAVIVGVLAFSLLASDSYWDLMKTLLNPKEDYNWAGKEDTGRAEIWKRGIGYMVSRPFTGVGARAFGVAEGTISSLASRQEMGIGLKWSTAHNSFVQIGAELGVFGLGAFIALLVYAFRTARHGRAPPRGRSSDEHVLGHLIAASIIGYAVSGFFLSLAYGAIVFALAAISLALYKTLVGAPAVSGEGNAIQARRQVSRVRRGLRGVGSQTASPVTFRRS